MGIALWALSPFFVYGQLLDPVDYQIYNVPDSVKAGEVFFIEIEAQIEQDWHLYSIHNHPDAGPYPTQLSVVSDGVVVAGKIEEDEADIAFDPNFNTELGWHSNSTVFKVPVALHTSLRGKQDVKLEVFYQVCDDKSCLPPKTKQVQASVIVYDVAEKPYTGFDETNGGIDSTILIRYMAFAVLFFGGIAAIIFLNKRRKG